MVAKKTTVAKTTAKKPVAKKTAVKRTKVPQHIGLVKNDGYLEPYEAAIQGRHDHAALENQPVDRKTARSPSLILPAAMTISVYTRQHADGCSESGHLTLRTSFLWVISTIGRKMMPTA